MASSSSLQGLTLCPGALPTLRWFLSQELSLCCSLIPSPCTVVILYHCTLLMKKLGPVTSNAFQMTECITSAPLSMALVIFSQKVPSQFVPEHMVMGTGLMLY